MFDIFLKIFKKQTDNLLKKIGKEKFLLQSLLSLSLEILDMVKSRRKIKLSEVVLATAANRATIKKHLKMNSKGKGTCYSLV